MRLQDKVAIITGAAHGIGRGIAMRFAREGAHVAICDLNAEGVKKVSQEISALGRKSLWSEVDVSDSSAVNEMVKRTSDFFPRIDILVNNAGGSYSLPTKLEEITDEIWDKVVNSNLKGTFLFSRAVAPHMKKQKSGRIINLASIAGRNGGNMVGPQYSSAKAGVMGLTVHLARYLGPYGITVNAIAPGIVLSGPRLEKLWMERKTEEERQESLTAIALRRVSTVEDQASVVVFLASDDAGYVTGVTLDVTGGWFNT
ncbi:MAG: SDR family oxidoreductase [Deltaproteobacteria bacterium]|nr:MAG: SDR family oxidoreductase [Deltaproteobacteria bacterium]